jgi:hypothetical protein
MLRSPSSAEVNLSCGIRSNDSISELISLFPGLYGANCDENTTIDVILGVRDDFMKDLVTIYYEKDETKKAGLKKDLEEKKLPHYMNIFEDILKENNGGDGFFVGNTVGFLLSFIVELNAGLQVICTLYSNSYYVLQTIFIIPLLLMFNF